MEQIKWAANRMPKSGDRQLGVMSLENVAKARKFHRSFPQYSVTPVSYTHLFRACMWPRCASLSRTR